MISSRPVQKIALNCFVYLMFAISSLAFILCIAAFVIIRIDTPEYVLIPLTTVLVTIASFINSFLLSKVNKENGLFTGLVTGCIFTAIIIAVAVYHQSFAFSNLFFTKAAAVMLAGALGGILGVNN